MSDADDPDPARATSVRRVALTGGIATGKSHVRALLDARGVPTIDSDTLARQAVAHGTPGWTAVVARFGQEIVGPDGEIDRHALGRIVFSDAAARRDLEAIVHPAVREATERWFTSLDPARHPFAVADIPLLFEVGRERDFEAVILTTCAPDTQLQRVIKRDRIAETEARQRIAAQLPTAAKIPRATYVIDTDGTFDETERQVDAVWRALASRT